MNRSSHGSFALTERSLGVACYAALLANESVILNMDNLVLAALFSDIALINLSPEITSKLREGKKLSERELLAYQNHPAGSLNLLRQARLSVPEELAEIILTSHVSGRLGSFPEHNSPEDIPIESKFIQMAEEFDRSAVLRFGARRRTHDEIARLVFESRPEFLFKKAA